MLGIVSTPLAILLCALVAYLIADALCRRADARNVLWRARVWWEGSAYTHAAKSEPEAREWAACYPADAHVSIESMFHGRSTFVAGRNVAL